MSDRLQEFRVFVRAAESGSFSRAGRELGLSQPSVSRIISELEARLGVTLLLRSTRRITVTEAGSLFLNRAREILADIELQTDETHIQRIKADMQDKALGSRYIDMSKLNANVQLAPAMNADDLQKGLSQLG